MPAFDAFSGWIKMDVTGHFAVAFGGKLIFRIFAAYDAVFYTGRVC